MPGRVSPMTVRGQSQPRSRSPLPARASQAGPRVYVSEHFGVSSERPSGDRRGRRLTSQCVLKPPSLECHFRARKRRIEHEDSGEGIFGPRAHLWRWLPEIGGRRMPLRARLATPEREPQRASPLRIVCTAMVTASATNARGPMDGPRAPPRARTPREAVACAGGSRGGSASHPAGVPRRSRPGEGPRRGETDAGDVQRRAPPYWRASGCALAARASKRPAGVSVLSRPATRHSGETTGVAP